MPPCENGSNFSSAGTCDSSKARGSLAELIARRNELLKILEEDGERLSSKIDSVASNIARAEENLLRKHDAVKAETDNVRRAKASLAEDGELLKKANAAISAAFSTPAPRLRYDATDFACSPSSAAIVSTIRAAPEMVLRTFIDYHLKLGFCHMFLYFDDEDDEGIAVASEWSNDVVTVQVGDATLRAQWETCTLWSELHDTVVVNNMSRQQLNAELASRRALQLQIDWLLHIDVDELFHLPKELVMEESKSEHCSPVARHFGSVPIDVLHVAYLNHEAVPEREGNLNNYFREVSLFRRNPHDVRGLFGVDGSLDFDAVEQAFARCSVLPAGDETIGVDDLERARLHRLAGVKLWADKSVQRLGSPVYFQGYSNGKSAARVVQGLRPHGVHRWCGQPGACQYMESDVAHVLHFANCGEDPFIEKHRRLLSCTSAYVREMPLYRQVVGYLRSNDEITSRTLYKDLVVLSSGLDVNDQLTRGTCFRADPVLKLDRTSDSAGHRAWNTSCSGACFVRLEASQNYSLDDLD